MALQDLPAGGAGVLQPAVAMVGRGPWRLAALDRRQQGSRAEFGAQVLSIERRSLHDVDGDVTVTLPSGEERAVGLEPAGDGIGTAQFQADERGLYRIEDGDLTTYAAMRPISSLELADMRATGERLTPLADTTGGAMVWLADDGLPAVRKTGEGRAQSGRDWIGFLRKDRYLVTGANQMPLLPAVLALLLLLGTLGAAWYREGR
ncbi:MAG: hypothetical protein R3F54_24180 [Alphaproteobacteria bacterium]